MADGWADFERYLRDVLTAKIESEPEVLLEHDGGPEGIKADLYLATLYGIDGQVDAEWRIERATGVLLRAISRRVTSRLAEPDPLHLEIPTARYELQSNYAWMDLDYGSHVHLLPSDVTHDPSTFLVRVVLLRYRHHFPASTSTGGEPNG